MSTIVQETITRTNHTRGQLNLDRHPDFTREYGEYKQTVARFYRYEYAGHIVQLRFSQDTYLWTAYCPQLENETQFINQSPQNIISLLNNWIDSHQEIDIDSFKIRPQAAIRQSTQAVRQLANRHGIPLTLADEMAQERGE